MAGSDPEHGFALAPHVTKPPVQLRRALEELQLPGVLDPLLQEPGVDHPATGQREIRLDFVETPVGGGQRTADAAEHGTFVEELGLLDSLVGSRGVSVSIAWGWIRCL